MHNAKKYKQEKIDANFWEKEKIKVMLIEQTRKKISLWQKKITQPEKQTYKTPSDLQVKISENAVINIELVRLPPRE